MNSHAIGNHFRRCRLTVLFQLSLLTAVFFLAAGRSAQAATLNVPSPQYPTVQSAVNAANPGDTIVLEAGRTFVEAVVLKYKPGNEYITIQSSATHSLPPEGHRINPSFSQFMPKIVPPNYYEPAISTEITEHGAAHHYKLIAIEIKQTAPNFEIVNLVSFGSGNADQSSLEKVAHHFVVDRCYIHGHPDGETRRGIALNSSDTRIINSHISDIHQTGYDSQAICGWNGPGRYEISNNYLEGAAENILFGGGDPNIPNLVPSDIEIRHNHITKPMAWRDRNPRWIVKNLLELKNARRVLIDRNIIENTWGFAYGGAQNGNAIVITVRNQDGAAPWSTIEDVMFTNNIVRRSGSGVQILATDDTHLSQSAKNLVFRNNLFEQINGSQFGGAGFVFDICNVRENTPGAQNVVITNNTAFHSGMFLLGEDDARVNGLKVESNIHREHVMKSGTVGTEGLNILAGSNWNFRNNAVAIENYYEYWLAHYPNTGSNVNTYLRSYDDVGFVNKAHGNYRLAPNSPLRNQDANGKDIGVDYKRLNAASTSADFDWNGKTDFVVWRPTNGDWYVFANNESATHQFHFGQSGDVPVAADYDGDGQTDYAVFRPSDGVWYVWQSSDSQVRTEQFGVSGDVPVPADYDGDGKIDFAVYRASANNNQGFWYVQQSSNRSMTVKRWGLNGDKPVVGDYDGDGKSDAAVYRPSSKTWFILHSFDNTIKTVVFGDSTDVPIPSDYDGDGRLDIATWRPTNGVWYVRRADGNFTAVHFGMSGDSVVPGDYDGDGKTDFAVYRASTGTWYAQQSSAGYKTLQFGASGDLPTVSATLWR